MNLKLGLIGAGILGVVMVAMLLLVKPASPSVPPPLPNPNGYTVLIQAANAVPSALPDPAQASVVVDGIRYLGLPALIELKLASGMTGGVARMADPTRVEEIVNAVSIPVMAKCRIGHFVEAQVLQSLGVDYIDESEVLTPADEEHHVNKWDFTVPFVCGCRNLGEALRRIAEGAAMVRTKGEPGTGNVVEAVRHMRTVTDEIAWLKGIRGEQLFTAAKDLQAPYELVTALAVGLAVPGLFVFRRRPVV